jgi:nucleoside-diphosphate-sugar epimerase
MSERVLVTGGLGFVGARLCAALLADGLAVRCVDDLSGSYADERGPAAIPTLAALGADVRIADVARADPAELMAGADAVVHLAGQPGVRTRSSPAALREANTLLTGRLVRAAADRGLRFVFVSSSSVYGQAAQLPTPEDAPLAPQNPYAASKLGAELMVGEAVRERAADAVIVRPFTVYGPGQRPDMAFARWIAAMAAGEPVPWHAPPDAARDFTYIDDAVAGLVGALRHGRAGRAYNVSGWRPVELRAALELLGAAELCELPQPGAEARITSGCGRRAAEELGYAPRVDLPTGLERQLAAAAATRRPLRGRRRLAA